MAESVALRFINEEDKLQVGLDWYEIIVQFANQYGIFIKYNSTIRN